MKIRPWFPLAALDVSRVLGVAGSLEILSLDPQKLLFGFLYLRIIGMARVIPSSIPF